MNNLIDQLAQQYGISKEQVQAGAGAILQLLQDKGGAVDFQQLLGAVPGAQAWMEQAKALPQQAGQVGGGLLGQAAGLVGALGGQGQSGLAGLLGRLGQAGFKPDSAAQFVPALLEQLKGRAGADVLNQLLQQVPALKAAAGEGGAAGMLGKLLK